MIVPLSLNAQWIFTWRTSCCNVWWFISHYNNWSWTGFRCLQSNLPNPSAMRIALSHLVSVSSEWAKVCIGIHGYYIVGLVQYQCAWIIPFQVNDWKVRLIIQLTLPDFIVQLCIMTIRLLHLRVRVGIIFSYNKQTSLRLSDHPPRPE